MKSDVTRKTFTMCRPTCKGIYQMRLLFDKYNAISTKVFTENYEDLYKY